MDNTMSSVLAFDFGGTKLAAAIINPHTGTLLSKLTAPTPASDGAGACLDAMFTLGEMLMGNTTAPLAAIGISYGGPVTPDRKRCVLSNHIPGWMDFPLVERTQAHFDLPTFMDNDANAAALGSWVFDAQKQPDQFYYVQASTGIGSGLVLNRQLYRGASMAGEIGHTKVEDNPAHCVCGNTGCLETICAGWGIAARAKEIANSDADLKAVDVFESIRKGDPTFKPFIEEAFTHFGVIAANTVAVLDLQQVIFGGGIFRSQDIIAPILLPAIEDALPSYMRGRCKFNFSTLNGAETLLGAALLPMYEQ